MTNNYSQLNRSLSINTKLDYTTFDCILDKFYTIYNGTNKLPNTPKKIF